MLYKESNKIIQLYKLLKMASNKRVKFVRLMKGESKFILLSSKSLH